MPGENDSNSPSVVPETVGRRATLDILLAELESGDGITKRLTERHIDTLLEQRGTIIERVHDDRKEERRDAKIYFFGLLAAALIVLGGVSYLNPDYFGEAVVALISALGGYGYGYGEGRKMR